MQLLEDDSTSNGDIVNRPAFNTRASITLEVREQLRFDRVQQTINEIRGLELYDIEQNQFTTIVFQSDRVNLKQLNEFAIKYAEFTNVNIFNNLVFITSRVINKANISNRETKILGSRYNPAISAEIPKTNMYGKNEVNNAFTFVGEGQDFGIEQDVKVGDPNSVDVGDSIVVTPDFNKKFRLTDNSIDGTYHNMAADDLQINLSSIIYAGRVTTSGIGSIFD